MKNHRPASPNEAQYTDLKTLEGLTKAVCGLLASQARLESKIDSHIRLHEHDGGEE